MAHVTRAKTWLAARKADGLPRLLARAGKPFAPLTTKAATAWRWLGLRLRRREARFTLCAWAFLAAAHGTGMGSYLNTYLFYRPVMEARFRAGLAPNLSPDLRVILVDDRALQKLGRFPTFAEWRAIAAHLRHEGYRRVILHGFHDLDAEIGPAAPSPGDGQGLVAGAVPNLNPANTRAFAANAFPPALGLPCPPRLSAGFASALPLAEHVIGPAPELWNELGGLGDVSLVANHLLPYGFRSPDGRAFPPLGLWAAGDLRCDADGFRVNGHPVPLSADGYLYTDFVTPASLYAQAIPVTTFYDGARSGVAPALSEKLRAKLKGGRVAIMVPEAHTGARFVDSPHGKVPGFFTTASLAHAALRERWIRQPWPAWLSDLAVTAVMAFVVAQPSFILAMGVGCSLLFLAMAVGGGLLVWHGLVLPVATACVILLLGIGWRAAAQYMGVLEEKIKLNHDLTLGTTVQQLLFPKEHRGQAAGWAYEITFRPYGAMSGDWIQLHASPAGAGEEWALLAIGDVVGKGPSAALITAVIASVWNAFVPHADAVPESERVAVLLKRLDEAIYHTFRGDQNSTVSIALLRPGKITYMSVAAPAWLKIAPGGPASSLPTPPANPLGKAATARNFGVREAEAAPGETFMAYSDGVMDGSVARARFQKLIAAQPLPADAPDWHARLVATAAVANADEALPDDFTLLTLRYVGLADGKDEAA